MAACGGYGWVLMTRRRWGVEQVALDDHVSVGRDTEKVRRRHKDLDSFLSSSAQLRKYTSIQIHPSIPNLASNPSGKSSVYSVLHLIPSHVALQLESLSASFQVLLIPACFRHRLAFSSPPTSPICLLDSQLCISFSPQACPATTR